MRGVLAAMGLLLIAFGVLVIVAPAILNYLVAGAFILVGLSMIAMAASARSVSYRQIDAFRQSGP